VIDGVFEGVFPSFLITFREALEAALIVAIMVAYLKKVGKGELNRYVYLGSGGAVVASLILGLIVQSVYGELKGVSAQLFEGAASLTAVVVLTYMIFWMTEHSKRIRGELQEKIDVAITKGELFGITILAFIAVFREGLETVLFLTAAFFLDPFGVVVGAILGSTIVLLLAVLLMKGAYRLDINKFFRYTSVLLILFAAGLAGYGVHELIEAGEGSGIEFGVWSQHAYDINPPMNLDGSYPLLHEKGVIGSVFKALIGYDGNPEWLRVIVYIGYWLIVGTYVLKTYRKS
jgi:high-affinity iron transporter